MSDAQLAWFKSSYSDDQGGNCLEVAYAWRKSSYSDSSGGACLEVAYPWHKSSYSSSGGGECLEVAYTWAGTFGETPDGLAYIGHIWQLPNCFFTLGFGGNGITYSIIAAEIIRDALLQRPNADSRLFRFDR